MKGFSVDFVNPMEFEWLAAEISYNGQLLCRVRNERADKQLELEFAFDARIGKEPSSIVPLREFMALLDEVSEAVVSYRNKVDGLLEDAPLLLAEGAVLLGSGFLRLAEERKERLCGHQKIFLTAMALVLSSFVMHLRYFISEIGRNGFSRKGLCVSWRINADVKSLDILLDQHDVYSVRGDRGNFGRRRSWQLRENCQGLAQYGGYLILTSRDDAFGGGFDNWVADEHALASYFKEAGWVIKWEHD